MSEQGEMHISESELRSMTDDLDEMHESTMPEVRRTLADWGANLGQLTRGRRASRRGFLLGASGVVALGAAAACSGGTSSSSGGSSSAAPSRSASPYTGDLRVVALAAALENLAVTAYKGAQQAAQAGRLGTVPPAVVTFIQTAMKQHADHANAWNAVLTGAKLPPITGAPLTITQQQVTMLNSAKSVTDVAKQALALENSAAQTYQFAAANVSSPQGISTAATIEPVEAQHAAILYFVLGQYPVPDAFIKQDQVLTPSALTA